MPSTSYKQICHEFIETTTINGLSRVAVPNRTRSFIWMSIVVTVFLCFGIHFYFMLGNFLMYPTNTQVVIEEGGFQFPDITFCTRQPFSLKKTDSNKLGILNATYLWYHILPSSIEKDIRFAQAEQKAQLSFRKFAYENDVYVDLLEHIVMCIYKGQRCKLNEFSVTRFPEKRNCFTFHPKERRYSEISSGMNRGLTLIIDTGHSFHIKPKSMRLVTWEGIEVTIHQNGSLPNLEDKFLLQKGKFNTLSVTMNKYTSLSRPGKHCRPMEVSDPWTWNPDRKNKLKFYRANRNTCRERKIQEYFLDRCKCWHEKYLIPVASINEETKSHPFCHEIPRHFFFNQKVDNDTLIADSKIYSLNKETNPEYKSILQRHECYEKSESSMISYLQNISDSEECEHVCERVSYSSVLAVSDYEFHKSIYRDLYEDFYQSLRIKNRTKSLDTIDLSRPLIVLMVMPAELDVEDTVETSAYPISAFMSDFGGNIGLWIGCTVITVAELLELIFRLTWLRMKRSLRTRRSPNELNLTENSVK